MSETLNEFIRDTNQPPRHYRSTGGVASLLQKTVDGNYELCFYLNVEFSDETVKLKYSTNNLEEFVQKVTGIEETIDSYMENLARLGASATRILVEDIDESSHRVRMPRCILKTYPLSVGSNVLSVADFEGKRICFVSNYVDDMHFTTYLDEEVYLKLRNIHQEYLNALRDFIDFLKNSGFKKF